LSPDRVWGMLGVSDGTLASPPTGAPMRINAIINNLTLDTLVEGLQGTSICNAAVNAANAIAARGEECILWDDDGDVVHYKGDEVTFLDRVSIRKFGFSSADFDAHVEACGVAE